MLILYSYLKSVRWQKGGSPTFILPQKQYAPSNMPANFRQYWLRNCSLMWLQPCTTMVLGSPVCPDIQKESHHLASLKTGLSTVDVSVSADSSAPWDLGSASLYHTREAILHTSAPRGSHTHPCTCQQGHWPETQPQSQQQPHNLTPASLDHKTRGSPISSRTRQ